MAMNCIGHRRKLGAKIVFVRCEMAERVARSVDMHRLEDDQPGSSLCAAFLICDVLVGGYTFSVEVEEGTVCRRDDSVTKLD
jgi:hypothetical protein